MTRWQRFRDSGAWVLPLLIVAWYGWCILFEITQMGGSR